MIRTAMDFDCEEVSSLIFIIGGAGFIGSALVRSCEASGRDCRVIDRENYSAFVGKSCEILINADGNSRKYLAKDDPVVEFDASVRSVRTSLEDFRYDLYLHLSSCDVYPDCSANQTTKEDSILDICRQSPYGFHKYLSEQCVQHVAARWIILRLGGFVGPGMKKNAIFDILNGGPLWVDPESELQFMRTDDAAKIALAIVEKGICNETFNLCGRGVVKLQEVIDRVGKTVPVHKGSPLIKYDVNIDKAATIAAIPDSRTAVFDFVATAIKDRSSR